MSARAPYPTPTSAAVTAVMKGNRKTNTVPEIRLRSQLHRLGLRFRRNAPIVDANVRADIAFSRAKIAVFVDGCFWHACPEHGTRPRANTAYWRPKLAQNIARDRRNDETLRALGWNVIRVWEHEDPGLAARRVARVVRRSRRNELAV